MEVRHCKGMELGEKKNTVVVGEAGTGKTEFSIAAALWLREHGEEEITVFDMDQTKPLYRLRDISRSLENKGIQVIHGTEFMDSPLVPEGVEGALKDEKRRVIMDVGGGKAGALCLGQYREALKEETQIFYLINPYRSFSSTWRYIARSMEEILSQIGRDQIRIICNPYCGGDGDEETFWEGVARTEKLLETAGRKIDAVMLPEKLWDKLASRWNRAISIRPSMPQVLDLG